MVHLNTVLFSEVTLRKMVKCASILSAWDARGRSGPHVERIWANPSQPLLRKVCFKNRCFTIKKRSKIPKSGKNLEKIDKKFFLPFFESRHHNMRQYAKQKLKFFPSLTFSEDLVWSTFYSKTRVFPTFLKRGWLGFAHIRSTCGPDLPRASHALRMDAHFRQGLPRKKVRCAAV